jgi:neutral ceramidase
VAIATADVLHLYLSLKLGVVKKLVADGYTALRDDNVLVTGTHTHSAPSNMSWYSTYDNVNGVAGFDPLNYAVVVGGIARSLEEAYDARKPATVKLSRGAVKGGATNRAATAYLADPDAKDYPANVNDTMTLLRFDTVDGKAIGALDFFGVHGTSLSIENRREHGDNKGYAAYAFEKAEGSGFVAAFAQAAFGDISPNSLDPSDPTKPLLRPSDLDTTLDPLEDPIVAGTPQLDAATALHASATRTLSVGLGSRYAYRDYDAITVDPAYVGTHQMPWDTGKLQYPLGTPVASPDPQVRTTCSGVVGGAILSGDPDGAPVSISPEGSIHNTYAMESGAWAFHKFDLTTLGPVLQFLGTAVNVLANTNQYDACHREKYALIGVGDGAPPSVPTILPLQLLQIGTLAIAAAPFELTTMTARRIEKQLLSTLVPRGVDTVVVAGMSNGYAQYMATREEYSTQYFEGSSTLFGPWAASATQQELDGLAQDLVANRSSMAGPVPLDLSAGQTSLTPIAKSGVPVDGPGMGFGAVLTDVKSEYEHARDTVTVTFQGAHPRSIQELQASRTLKAYYDPTTYSYFEIQKQSGTDWKDAYTDGDPHTAFDWADASVLGNGASTVSVTWLVRDAEPGTYRIVYNGLAKTAVGSYMPFHGTSGAFVIR